MRLKRLVRKFLTWCSAARKRRTADNYRWLLKRFLRHVGNKKLHKFRPIDLEMWGKTWHEVQAVQRLFEWAKKKLRVITENPFSEVPRPPGRQRTRIFSRRELVQYLRRCGSSKSMNPKQANCRAFRNFLLVMRGTLARPQEVRAFTWPMVQAPIEWPGTIEEALHAGKAMIVLREFKARERMANPDKPRVILMTRRVGRLLLRLRRNAQSLDGAILLNAAERPWSANAIRCRMRRLRGLFPKCAADGQSIVAYSMRHTAATYASPKIPQKVLAELLGHQSVKTTERYQHLQVDHLHEGMAKLEERKKKAA